MKSILVTTGKALAMALVALSVGAGIAWAGTIISGTTGNDDIDLKAGNDRLLMGDGTDEVDFGAGDATIKYGTFNYIGFSESINRVSLVSNSPEIFGWNEAYLSTWDGDINVQSGGAGDVVVSSGGDVIIRLSN